MLPLGMSWLSLGCQIEGLVGLGVEVGKGYGDAGVGVYSVDVGSVDVGAEKAGRARLESRMRWGRCIVGCTCFGVGMALRSDIEG
jgi:hypothetical protein